MNAFKLPSNIILHKLSVAIAAVHFLLPAQADEGLMTVDDLVAEVFRTNPEIKIYEAEIEAAGGERWQTTRWSNPDFSLEIGHKRVRGGAGAASSEGIAWAASVVQPIEFPGRMALRKAIADRNIELAEMGMAHFHLLLEARVRSLAYALFATRAAVEATDEVANRARDLTETFLQREAGGISPLLEQRILEGSVLALEERRQAARRRYQRALIEINQLRNAPAETPLRIAEPPLRFPEPEPIQELVSGAWKNAFDARARLVELEQQGFRIELARNERYPTLSVGPYFSHDMAGDGEVVVGLALSMPLPLWDRNQGNITASRARLRQAEALLLATRRELEGRIVEAALYYQDARESLLNLNPETLDQFAQAAELAERHYRLGAIPISMYLEMQNAYLDALDAVLDLRQETLRNQLELNILTGNPYQGAEP